MSLQVENVSEEKYFSVNRLYSEQFDLPHQDAPPEKRLLIASIPRSGSTNLCINLWRAGSFGAPLEYYNLQNRSKDMLVRLGDGNSKEYIRQLSKFRMTPNGVFSAKAFVSDLKQLAQEPGNLLAEVHATTTLYFTRENKLDQAISYARAYQTGKWFSTAGQTAPPEYNRDLINSALGWISEQEESWERIFARTACEPIRLSYERFLAAPHASMSIIAETLGVELNQTNTIDVPGIDVQRDLVSDNWRERFLEESPGICA